MDSLTTPRPPLFVWSAIQAHETSFDRLGAIADRLERTLDVWNGEPEAFRGGPCALLVLTDIDGDDGVLRERIAALDAHRVAVVVLVRSGDITPWADLDAVALAVASDAASSHDKLAALLRSADRASRDRAASHTLSAITDAIKIPDADSDDFLHAMVRHLSTTLGLQYVFVGESEDPSRGGSVTTRALWVDGRFADNFTYDLEGTPCINVLEGPRVCIYPSEVAKLFPDDHMLAQMSVESYVGAPVISQSGRLEGLLVALDTVPRHDAELLAAVMEFFAGRAASEIARDRHDRRLESLNAELEQRIGARTQELERAQAQLVETAHRAGMADVAVSVMHNIGNVLNSVVTASEEIRNLAGTSAFEALSKVIDLIEAQDDLVHFLTRDERGKRVPELLAAVRNVLDKNLRSVSQEAARIRRSADLMDGIIKLQLVYTDAKAVTANVDVRRLLDDVIALQAPEIQRQEIALTIECQAPAKIRIDRVKLLQVLTNLLVNAITALNGRPNARITIRTAASELGLRIELSDNGVGIAPTDLPSVFQLGFTSKPGSLGLGLHSCACSLKELGGTIEAHSDGVDRGARFRVDVPVQPPA